MSEKYYLISLGEDASVVEFNREQLLDHINEMSDRDKTKFLLFLRSVEPSNPPRQNINEIEGYILIKGQAILPKPVEKITRLEVE